MSWNHLQDVVIKKARRWRRCYLCQELIEIGTSYVNRKGVNGGEIMTMAMHPECESASSDWDEMTWECFEEGSMERGIDKEKS